MVDRDRFRVVWNGRPCPLGNTLEFRFVERLHRARGAYLPIEVLGADVWDDVGVSKLAVQRVASNLRRLLGDAGAAGILIDGRQKGHYRLVLAGR